MTWDVNAYRAAVAAAEARNAARAKMSRRARNAGLRSAVWARDHGICARCAADTTASLPARPTRTNGWDCDHIRPVHLGGSDHLSNLQTLCIPCHAAKSAAESRARADGRADGTYRPIAYANHAATAARTVTVADFAAATARYRERGLAAIARRKATEAHP